MMKTKLLAYFAAMTAIAGCEPPFQPAGLIPTTITQQKTSTKEKPYIGSYIRNPYDSVGIWHNIILDSLHAYTKRISDTTRAGTRQYVTLFAKNYWNIQLTQDSKLLILLWDSPLVTASFSRHYFDTSSPFPRNALKSPLREEFYYSEPDDALHHLLSCDLNKLDEHVAGENDCLYRIGQAVKIDQAPIRIIMRLPASDQVEVVRHCLAIDTILANGIHPKLEKSSKDLFKYPLGDLKKTTSTQEIIPCWHVQRFSKPTKTNARVNGTFFANSSREILKYPAIDRRKKIRLQKSWQVAKTLRMQV